MQRNVLNNSWVSLCKYAVNLSGGQPQLYSFDVYAILETAFATKHEANTISEHLIHFHDDVSI